MCAIRVYLFSCSAMINTILVESTLKASNISDAFGFNGKIHFPYQRPIAKHPKIAPTADLSILCRLWFRHLALTDRSPTTNFRRAPMHGHDDWLAAHKRLNWLAQFSSLSFVQRYFVANIQFLYSERLIIAICGPKPLYFIGFFLTQRNVIEQRQLPMNENLQRLNKIHATCVRALCLLFVAAHNRTPTRTYVKCCYGARVYVSNSRLSVIQYGSICVHRHTQCPHWRLLCYLTAAAAICGAQW